MRDSFVLYTSIAETLERLTDAQKGELFQAILDYELDKEINITDSIVEIAFIPIRQSLEQNNAKWEKTKAARSEAGKKSAEVRRQKATNLTNVDFVQTKENKKEQKGTNSTVYVNDNVNVYVNDKDIKDVRHRRGEYSHVLLSDKDIEKLNKDYGEEKTKQAITYLDEYKERKGYKCKNDYLTLKKWVYDALDEQKARIKPTQIDERTYDFTELEKKFAKN